MGIATIFTGWLEKVDSVLIELIEENVSFTHPCICRSCVSVRFGMLLRRLFLASSTLQTCFKDVFRILDLYSVYSYRRLFHGFVKASDYLRFWKVAGLKEFIQDNDMQKVNDFQALFHNPIKKWNNPIKKRNNPFLKGSIHLHNK